MAALSMTGKGWESHDTVRESYYSCLKAGSCRKTFQDLPWHPQKVDTVVLEPNSAQDPFTTLPAAD